MPTKAYILLALLIVRTLAFAANVPTVSWICDECTADCFPLSDAQSMAGVYYDPAENVAVHKAIKNLIQDVVKVSGRAPQLCTGDELPCYPIIIGTCGQSKIIDKLAKQGIIQNLEGQWESFQVKVVDAPLHGVKKALVIAGSDRRGTIYGIYELSRQIGVSPWHWWLDVPVAHKDVVYVKNIDFASGEPSVKYRGVFINDEFPSMTSWAKAKFGGMNSEMYAHVYELLLRLRANCLWPGMWGSFKEYKPLVPIYKDEYGLYEGNCFNEDDPANPRVADEYGIVVGTSHHEPMQRSQQEWIRHKGEYGNGKWNFLQNKKGILDFFRDGIKNAKDYDNIITIGMRGDEDRPMDDAGSAEANFRLMQQIIKEQRNIISSVTGKPASATPQVWTLYSEVLDYYDQGLDVPDDVIIMFCDDNFGNVRRLPNLGQKKHPGGYGMYYHVGYYGAPRACKWLNATQIQHIWEQMRLTYEYGVDKIWMLNIGDLKPHEFPIDFFMEMAWAPQRFNADNLLDYTTDFCSSVLGKDNAADAAYLLDAYNKYASWIHPELLDANTYDVASGEYAEAANAWLALEARAARLEKRLAPEQLDAYRQLLGYPIEAMANLYDMYYNLAMHRTDQVKKCYERDSVLTLHYNKEMSGGKWDHMMDQPHIGYASWHGPQQNIMPTVPDDVKSPRGGYAFLDNNGTIIMDACHFFTSKVSEGKIWNLMPNLGRWDDGLALEPVTKSPEGEMLNYKFEMPDAPDSVQVTVITKSTMPFLAGGHSVGLSMDDNAEVSVPLNHDLNWEHKYDLMYPTGASRVIRKSVKLPINSRSRSHMLSVRPLQPGIVFYKIIVDGRDSNTDYRLRLPESRYSIENQDK